MLKKSIILTIVLLTTTMMQAQSPFASNKQSVLFSNAQSGASERWISLFAPTSLAANYRLIFPTAVPTAGQMLNIASISGNDYTMQWATGVTGSGTATQVAFWSSTSALSSSVNLYWDNTNGRLGIGTSTPAQKLEILNGNVLINNNNNTSGELRIAEPSTSGTNYTAFKAQAQASNLTYTLPAADGTSGAKLQTDGAGALTWSNVGTVKYARKTANEDVTSSTTLQDDDHLTLSVGANEVWECEIFFRVVVTSNTNGGVKMKLNFPTGTSVMMQSQAWIGYDASTGYLGQDFITGSYNFYYTGLKTDVSGGNVIRLHGMINVGSTAGSIQWQFSQQTSNAISTTGAVDSYMKLTRIQ